MQANLCLKRHFRQLLLVLALFQPTFAVEINSSPNDFLDDSAAIKAAILTAQNGFDKTVRFHDGSPGYLLSEPIVQNAQHVQLVGPEFGYATISPQFGSGPAILAASARRPLDLLPSLAKGPGSAMSLAPPNYLYASDTPTMRINGLSELTIEAFVSSIETDINEPNVVLSSQGVLINSYGVDSAFRVMVRYGNALQVDFKDTAGYHQFASGNVWTAGTHHIAFQYQNGSALLFLDGEVVAVHTPKRTRRGITLVQKEWEEVMIGGAMGSFPYGGYFFNAVELEAIDGIRISNVARYSTKGFDPPTTKPVRDANTLLLCNFDFITPEFVRAETSQYPYYAWLTLPVPDYSPTNPFGQIGNVGVRNLQVLGYFGASGVYGLGTVSSIYQNIRTINAWQGMLLNDVYFSRIQDVILTSQRGSLWIVNQGEALTIDRAALYGGYFPFALNGSVGGDFRNLFFTPQANTVASALIKGGDVALYSPNVDDEGQAGVGIASIIAGDFTSLSLYSGQILNYSTHPTMYVDGAGQGRVLLSNTAFFSGASVPRLIHVTNPRAGLVYGSGINFSGTPITNEPTAVSVDW